MCGIAGILNIRGDVSPLMLEKMTTIVRHRGPDDEGYALFSKSAATFAKGAETISDFSSLPAISEMGRGVPDTGGFFLGFGHRRLSILDVTKAGHQPMSSEDGSVTVVYNGEIYNYIEIREELKTKGYKFSSTSDTEVLINAWREWGESCVTRFNGMWAFALWDSSKKLLFCSRDRLGVKPFYYYLEKNRLIFASELKQFTCFDDVPKIMDEETLSTALIYGVTDYNENTFIRDIKFLKGGCNLLVSLDGVHDIKESMEIHEYWRLDTEFDDSARDFTGEVGDEFVRACRWRMRSDVPVGALLSGGLDSSAMVTEICAQLRDEGLDPSNFDTFTSCYDDSPENDEREFAHIVNVHSGAHENFIFPDVPDIEADLEKIIWHGDGMVHYSLLGSSKVIEAVHRKGIKVCLNGQGGDESMLGYERYYAFYFLSLLKKMRWVKAFSEYRLAAKNSRLSLKRLLQYFVYFNFPSVRNQRNMRLAKQYYNSDVIEKLNYPILKPLLYPKTMNELYHNEIRAGQLTHILRWDDRLYMMHSIESRVPFIDYRFVEAAAKIPPEYKIQKGFTKYLIRDLMKGKMPDAVTWRINKMGFQAPVERFAANFSEAYIEDLFQNPRSRKYFNTDRVRALMKSNPTHMVVQKFICTELFMRLFDVVSA
jgi:asparagine synthase (glutamine-hydrolysing)